MKDPTCPATSTTINTTAEYNTSATESTQSITTPQLTESTVPQRECAVPVLPQRELLNRVSPKKDPMCPATSATINTTAEYNTSATESTNPQLCQYHRCNCQSTTEEYNTSASVRGVPKKDPTCPAKSSTISITAEYNTSATESTLSVSTTEGVCVPKKDPTCPTTSTTISTTTEYNTSATESTELSS
ncbi:uncharacterized protein [Macrobrachium rosenbergii]|uniref:uncharacterized protein n=1 Tax=Macrobrachium rosenbergii TaxID=79674 RepID=UPI0034D56A7B